MAKLLNKKSEKQNLEKNSNSTKSSSAHLKYARVSPYKLRKVADLIRNKNAVKALLELNLMTQKSSFILSKLVNSCIANATNNFNLNKNNLIISKIMVNEGPKLKRMQPRARGRSFRILKPTAHVIIQMTEKGEPYGAKN